MADAILYDVGAADDLAGDEEMFSDIEDYDDLQ